MSFEYIPRITQNDFYDFYNDTLVPTAEIAMNAVQNGAEILYQGVKQAEGYWEELNVQVKEWTETKMSHPLTKITQVFVHALPVLVLFNTTLPIIYTGCLIYAGCKVTQLIRQDNPHPNTSNMFINAVGFLFAREVLFNLGTAALTLDSSLIGLTIYEAITASVLFDWSGLAQDVYNAPIQTPVTQPQSPQEEENEQDQVEERVEPHDVTQEEMQEEIQDQHLYPSHLSNTDTQNIEFK